MKNTASKVQAPHYGLPTRIVALVTALSLVFLQVPITGYTGKAMADATEAAQEQLAANTAVDVPLAFEHAYITYAGQVVAEPATKVTIPGGAPMEFTASADAGYQLESVVAVIDGAEAALAPDAGGLYRLSASEVALTSSVTVRALTAPTVEDVVAVEAVEGGEAADATAAASADPATGGAVVFEYEDDAVKVVATPAADALPEGAWLSVTQVTPATEGYNYGAYMEALNEGVAADEARTDENTLLYDVAFLVAGDDGAPVEVQPADGAVKVEFQFKQAQLSEGLSADDPAAVEVTHLPLTAAAKEGADTTAQATDITADDIVVEAIAASDVTAKGADAIEVVADEFSLYGISYVPASASAVTAQAAVNAIPTSTDLADYLTGVQISAPQNADGKYVVTEGSSYSFTLAFAETQQLQFPDDDSIMSYKLPDGLEVADGQQGSLSMKVNDAGTFYTVAGNRYWVQNGVLYFQFNTSDPNFSKLTAASNAKINVTFAGTVGNSSNLHFRDGISKDLEIDTSNSVTASKSAWFDKGNNKVHYTVAIVSKGLSKNVNVKDTITGTGLSLDAGSIRATSSTGATVSMSGNASGNSFDYTIPQMKDGEVVTFTYDANIDPSQIPLQDGKYFTVGTNKVSVKSDGDPTPDTIERTTTIDYTPTIRKSNATIASEGDGKKVLDWTITANEDAKVSMAGTKITDTINDQSKSFMKYTGSGISVDVFDASGAKVETRTVSWSQLTSKSDYSWTYTVPQSDAGKAYKYVITYQTVADVSTKSGTVDLGNNVSTDGGKSSGGGIQVIGSGGNSGGNTGGNGGNGGNSGPDITVAKSAEKVDLENMEITWKVIFNVPSSGLASAVVTDTAPNRWIERADGTKVTAIDFVKEDSISVEGLKAGESYSLDFTYPQQSWDVINNAVITFYQDVAKTTPGLQGGSERTITVTLKTQINEEWLDLYERTGNTWDQGHTNSVSLAAAGKTVNSTATAQAIKSSVTKTAQQVGTRTVNGVDLPIYKYTLVLANMSSDYNVIEDEYDTSLLEPYEGDVQGDNESWFSWRLTNFTNSVRLDQTVPYVFTDKGIRFTTSSDCIPRDSNSASGYYAQYKLIYYLTVKDEAAMQAIVDRAAESEGGVYAIGNTAEWNGNTDGAEVTYEYAGLTKEILTSDDQLKSADEDIWADFRITLNPSGAMLNGGEPMTMTDTYENLSIDFNSITATPSAGVTWDASGNVVTYQIPDQTKVVITYRARVVFDDNGAAGETKHVQFSNVAEMNGYRGEVNKSSQRTNSGAGSASINAIYLLKYQAGDMTNRLAGAKFALLDASKNPVLDKWGNAVEFTTPEDGRIEVQGDQEQLGWTIQEDARYYLRELVAPDGYALAGFDYSFQVSGDGTTDYSKYIYHNGDTMTAKNYPGTDVKVVKEWTDGNGRHDGDAVVVKLQQKRGDGEWSDVVRVNAPDATGAWVWQDLEMTAELGAANDWAATFAELPLEVPVDLASTDGDDIEVSYRVVETLVNGEAPAAGTSTVTQEKSGGATVFTVTNQSKVETVEVPVRKVWDDSDGKEGLRPATVEVALYADGKLVEGSTKVLSEANGWTDTWTDLPKLSGSDEIEYTVRETTAATGYDEPVYTTAADGTRVITNKRTPETTSVSVQKNWAENGGANGMRPTSVAVALKNGDTIVSYATLNADNGWKASWNNLPKYADGKLIEYTVTEPDVPTDYTVSYSSATTGAGKAWTVTNTYAPETTNVKVHKEWSDSDNVDKSRPTTVSVQLLANGEAYGDAVTLTAANGWNYEWTGLPVRMNQADVTYAVSEVAVPAGYTSTVSDDAAGSFTITNAHVPDTTTLTVTKDWQDAANRDNIRPESVKVRLLADGQAASIEGVDAEITLDESNHWTHTWTGLPKNKAGEVGTAIAYTVDEVDVPSGYEKPISGDAVNGYVIANAHEPAVTSVTVSKEWSDANNQDGYRPSQVTVQLKADGVDKGAAVVLNADNDWTYTWTNLPLNKEGANGEAIEYTVEEGAVAHYTATVAGNAADGFTITNAHAPDTTSITGTKAWNDKNNQDGKRASSVQLQLNKNGKPYGDPVTVTAADSWRHTWENLDVREGGEAIAYTVTEIGADAAYAVTPGTAANGYTVTNAYAPEKTAITVLKDWKDSGDFDGLRPTDIYVQLKAGDALVGDAVALNEGNGWTHTWSDLDKYANGSAIAYTVDEVAVPAGYEKAVTASEDGTTFTIVNTHTPVKTSASVEKAWDDADNQDGKRPASVKVQLLQGGTVYDEVTLNAANEWKASWTELPTIVGGHEVTYSIAELTEVEGYETTYENDGNDYVITNSHAPETTEVTATKAWNDASDQDGKRGSSTLKFQLKAGDAAVGDPVEVGTADDFTYTWTDLPVYQGGVKVAYSVVELDQPEGYSSNLDATKAGTFAFTNSYTPGETSITVTKAWNDDDDHDGLRPDSVSVQLLAGGSNEGDAVELSEANHWTYTWTGLDEYRGGSKVSYTVAEVGVPAGYASVTTGDAATGYTITNTHTPTYTTASVKKAWEDGDDQDGLRGNIAVQLYANGVAYGDVATLTSANGWSSEWAGLPTVIDGKDVAYTIGEVAKPAGYETSTVERAGNAFTITNARTPETTEVSVTKVWSDADDQDGLRPDSIQVRLSATVDGTAYDLGEGVDTTVTLGGGAWTHTWANLPKNAGGAAIAYSVDEVAVPAGYEKSVSGTAETGFAITNAHVPATTEIAAVKAWNDNDDHDGLRPASIQVRLSATVGGQAYALPEGVTATATLSEGNRWATSWEGLPVNAGGAPIAYTVSEVGAVAGYEASGAVESTVDGVRTFTITNTHEDSKISITGHKAWSDEGEDAVRPDSVKLQLLANGEPVGEPVVVSAADNWSHTWSGLDEYADKAKVVYTVTEVDVDERFSFTPGNAANGYTVTNSYAPGETNVSVGKVWDDADNVEGLRPSSVLVQLKADGEAAGDAVELNEGNNWAHTWTGLDKYADGVAIEYAVEEVGSPAGYAAATTGDAATGFTITNARTPEVTQRTVQKLWDDGSDQDGIRPEAVSVTLLANGEEYATVSLGGSDDEWSYTWKDLPKYRDGKEVSYTIRENTPLGDEYTATASALPAGVGFLLKNTHAPDETAVSVEKTWSDADDNDGMRPESIEVRLNATADGAAYELAGVEATATLNDGNSWSAAWTGLPKNAQGKAITYSVSEVTVPVGYRAATSSAAGADGSIAFTITNAHELEKTSVKVTKAWDDADDYDGLRPGSVKVQLYADDVAYGPVETLGAGSWTHTWANLPKYAAGHEVVYTVAEVGDVAGYTAAEPAGSAADGFTITNAHTPEKVSITGSKTWDDADNQDGKRTAVELRLMANGVQVDSKVGPAEDWSYTWTGLDKYAAGKEIAYTVEEAAVADYTLSAAGSAAEGFALTNSYTPGKTSVSVTKAWSDADDQDGLRPDSVTVRLLAGGKAAPVADAEVVLSDENGWTYTWSDLDAKAAGQDIAYTVEEAAVAGYTAKVAGDAANGFTITNAHTPATVDLSVVKEWVDGDDHDGLRPASVEVELRASVNGVAYDAGVKDAVVVLNDGNGWQHSWSNLPENAHGAEIVYTVVENTEAAGYATEVSRDGSAFTVTNTHEVVPVEVSGTKTWDDADDQDGKRPDSITVNLLANGEKADSVSVTPDANGTWSYAFTGLDRYAGGELVEYAVTENAVAGYTTAIEGYDITNTHIPETVDVSGTKAWDDAGDQDGKRPESITVNLLANGTQVDSKTVSEGEDGTWSYAFTGLPKYAGGSEIAYAVTEDAVADYTTAISGFDITNTHIPETVDVSGTKTWADAGDQDGKRPESITVNLLADGKKVDSQTIAGGEGDTWSYAFTGLPKYAGGSEIAYAVTEDAVADYTTTISGYDITNSYTPGKTSVSGIKTWDDDGNRDNIRPASIVVNLLADGEQVDSAVVEPDADGVWAYAFTDLDEYANGHVIEYTVTEATVPGYTAEIDGTSIVNTHAPETVDVSGTKTWADDGNRDNIRPASIVVNLLADGTEVREQVVTPAADGTWSYSFTGLPKYNQGTEISYIVTEDAVAGYDASIDGYDITNTHAPETVDVFGAKTWDDDGNRDNIRPASITVRLLANGVEVDSATVTARDGWAYSFAGLPKNDAGVAISYTVAEDDIEGYDASISGYAITNTHAPETVDVSGAKTWDDADDQDGKRPASITVNLLADGEKVDSKTLDASSGWSYAFTGLPKNAAGKAIAYTVTENAVADYQTTIDGYDITNSYTPGKTSVSGTKAWDDSRDQDGKRPESITVNLLANGRIVDSQEVTAEGGWTFSFGNLDEYAGGRAIEYTVEEDADSLPEGYVSLVDETEAGFVITNSRTPEVTSLTVPKVWEDGDDRDGVRPEGAEIVLYADGEAYATQTVTAGEAGDWTYTFANLPKYKNGVEIEYTIGESNVAGAYESSIEPTVTGVEVVNTHVPATVDISGAKTWDDHGNLGNVRPESITVRLLADGEEVASKDVTAEDGWAWTFAGMSKYRDGGTPIAYTIEEDPVAGYSSAVDGFDVVNTHPYEATAEVEFYAQKTLLGSRTLAPADFTFELREDGELVKAVVNNGAGQAYFGPIAYTLDDVGVHHYSISEVAGDLLGVTYDTTVHEFTATVTDNGDGTLGVAYDGYDPETGAEFTNTYTPSGTVELVATKLLDGAAPEAGAYEFQVADAQGNVYATATNDEDGVVTFPALSFKAAGTYRYLISEVVPAEAQRLGTSTVADGVAFDTHKVGVTIEAVDNFNGTLRFDVSYDEPAAFENATVPDVTFPLAATKVIEGRDFSAGDEFTFTVAGSEGAPMPENDSVTVRPASGTQAAVEFGDITFTVDDLGKSYTYTVTEQGAGQTVDGTFYDPFAHWVTLTVIDAGDGTLGVTAEYQNDAAGMTFTNTYGATGQISLGAVKVLTGRALVDGEFFFELSGGDLPAPLHASAAADGTVTFPTLTFTQDDVGRDIRYSISEVTGSLGGVMYDPSVHDVVVHVADNGDGTLSVTADYEDGAEPVFRNAYTATPASVELTAHKALVGGTLSGGEFAFTLSGVSDNAAGTQVTAVNDADGLVSFGAVDYDAAGVYSYRIAEVVPADAVDNGDGTFSGADGIVYDGSEHAAVVTVVDDGYGKLVATVDYDGGAAGVSFGNTALARTGFTFDKYFFGGVGTFDFTLTAVDAEGAPRAGEAADYSDEAAIVDDGAQAFTVTVQNGAYAGGVAQVVFPEIAYAADGDYHYLVEEAESSTPDMVADAAQYLVHVTVAGGAVTDTTYELVYDGVNYGPTDDLAFYNNSAVTLGFSSLSTQGYTDEAQRASVYPKAQKYLNDSVDMLVGGDFTFELVDEATGTVLAVATNDQAGNIAFFDEDTDPGLVFDEPGIYRYILREVNGGEAGMIYDDSEIALIVTVEQGDEGLVATTTYNGPGGAEPAFYNVREGIDVVVQKVSRYGGEGLVDCTYALWMVGENGDVMIQEATSDANGYIEFKNVNLIAGQKYYFKEVEAPIGHTVDPYRTAYLALNEEGTQLVVIEETAADGWHSAIENIELDRAKQSEASE